MEIRRLHQNNEYIFKVTLDDGNTLYIKDVNPLRKEKPVQFALTLRIVRSEDNSAVLYAEDCLMGINPQKYMLDSRISLRTTSDILSDMESLVAFSSSNDGIKWSRYIRNKSPFIYFFQYEFQIISGKRIVVQDSEGKWAVLDYDNNIIVPFGKYTKIDGFRYQVAKVRKTFPKNPLGCTDEVTYNLFGIIDINGNEVVECVYDIIYKFYGKDTPYTKLFSSDRIMYFHLGYQVTFGSLQELGHLQYLEDRGELKWKG